MGEGSRVLDYVVAGFGIGAILALIGFALWELYGNRDEPGHGWLTRAAIGAMLGSLVIWSITGVTLVSTLDDTTASRVVMVTTLITIAAIVAGSLWYWRVDQAVLASMPQQRAQETRNDSATAAAAAAQSDAGIELSEWDSWPERGEAAPNSPEPAGAAPDEARFEPEVAAEPEAIAEGQAEASTETVEVEAAAAVAEAEDVVIGVVVEAPAEEAVEAVMETAELARTPEHVERADDSPSEDEAEAPLVALPANVRPFRTPKAAPDAEPEPLELAEVDEPSLAPEVDEDEHAEHSAGAEPPKPNAKVNGAPAATEPSAPAGFESSLLADIDATTAEDAGRYRSPLLADLEQDPNELEGVGLAKWRPEARLTTDERDDVPPPKGRRKR